LSREQLVRTLESLGLSQVDVEVYLCLSKEPEKARSIGDKLEISKQQIYRSLRNLRANGLVIATSTRPAQFSAVSLEKILELVMTAATEQAKTLQASKEELLSTWHSIIKRARARGR
jgi:sugar-specific transcriptional regulator TrmB